MGMGFRKMSDAYLSFYKQDRNGILFLMILIILLIIARNIIHEIEIKPSGDNTEMLEFIKVAESMQHEEVQPAVYFYFDPNLVTAEKIDSFPLPSFVRKNILSYREAGGRYKQPADLRKIYGMNDSLFRVIEPWLILPAEKKQEISVTKEAALLDLVGRFDPNTATADTLMHFGFSQQQVATLIKYRSRGGIFYERNDLLKIYGIDSIFYNSIEKFIHISKVGSSVNKEVFTGDPFVEINSADSADLVLLRGIGPVFASRIIKYRNLLGGYYSPRQLLEVYNFPEETYNSLKETFTVDTLRIEKLRLNFAGYGEMLRHPYFNKKNIAAILDFRQKNGSFSEPVELLQFGLVDSSTFVKIEPYITCR